MPTTNNSDKEKNWIQEVPPEHVPINIKEYNIKEQKKIRDKIESNPTGRNFIVESLNSNPLNNKNSNEEDKKNIGRWGEEYAIIYIKSELEKIHPNIPLIDTKEGFKLKKDDDTIAEVIWFNKEKEGNKSPDIILIKKNEDKIFIEVKSTIELEKDWFFVTKFQWDFIKEKGDKFYIYRVYGAGTNKARLEKIHNPAKLWKDGYIYADPINIKI